MDNRLERFEKNINETYEAFVERVKSEYSKYHEFWHTRGYQFIVEAGVSSILVEDGLNDPILIPDNLEIRVLSDLAETKILMEQDFEPVAEREVGSHSLELTEYCQGSIHHAHRMMRLWRNMEMYQDSWYKVVLFVRFNGTNVEIPDVTSPDAAKLLEEAILEELDVQRAEYLASPEYKAKQLKEQQEIDEAVALGLALEDELNKGPFESKQAAVEWIRRYCGPFDRVGVNTRLNVGGVLDMFELFGYVRGIYVGLAPEAYKNEDTRLTWLIGQFMELLLQNKGVPPAYYEHLNWQPA